VFEEASVGPVPNRREAVQAFDPLLQCISILAQYRNRLHVSTLIASSRKIVDILLELLGSALMSSTGG
jgi:hypothetical protein